ncbi:MAG: 3-oxoacyl-ACP reductase FabG [Hespellia sp.]|nr:3-oxoacyl-ACP reductase FabG [Hespellia sp.]
MKKKSVLVTGASRGIGKACAIQFAKKGYRVYINCSRSKGELESVKQEIDEIKGEAVMLVGDVGNPQSVREMFVQIQAECGGLDVLVNNAGRAYIGLLTDMSDEDWNGILSSNLSSAFYCCRAAVPPMVSKKAGKIINISSMWGNSGASCEAAYSATKAGMNGLTKALAKELAPSNIQVNAIACGVIDTVMNSQLNEEERQQLADEIPQGRFGTTQEVAELVLELAENHAYLTGQIIGLDGGFF